MFFHLLTCRLFLYTVKICVSLSCLPKTPPKQPGLPLGAVALCPPGAAALCPPGVVALCLVAMFQLTESDEAQCVASS